MVAECEAAKKANPFMQIGAYKRKGKVFDLRDLPGEWLSAKGKAFDLRDVKGK